MEVRCAFTLSLILDSILGEDGIQLLQPHLKLLLREVRLAVCKEAKGISVVFLGEHPRQPRDLVEYLLGRGEAERGGVGGRKGIIRL